MLTPDLVPRRRNRCFADELLRRHGRRRRSIASFRILDDKNEFRFASSDFTLPLIERSVLPELNVGEKVPLMEPSYVPETRTFESPPASAARVVAGRCPTSDDGKPPFGGGARRESEHADGARKTTDRSKAHRLPPLFWARHEATSGRKRKPMCVAIPAPRPP